MVLVKLGEKRYVNVDRMTHVEPKKKGKLLVSFGVASQATLRGAEAQALLRWMEANAEKPGP